MQPHTVGIRTARGRVTCAAQTGARWRGVSQRNGMRASAQQKDDVELPAAGIWLVWKLVCCAGVLLGGAGACMELAAAGGGVGTDVGCSHLVTACR